MDTLSYKTISANKATVTKEWVIVDATDQVLGRLGAKVAKLLRGKYKPNFTPHVDCGDNVIIINADKVNAALLRAAGVGVAMGNACGEALNAADYVTASVDDDGIRKALEKFGVI